MITSRAVKIRVSIGWGDCSCAVVSSHLIENRNHFYSQPRLIVLRSSTCTTFLRFGGSSGSPTIPAGRVVGLCPFRASGFVVRAESEPEKGSSFTTMVVAILLCYGHVAACHCAATGRTAVLRGCRRMRRGWAWRQRDFCKHAVCTSPVTTPLEIWPSYRGHRRHRMHACNRSVI